MLASQKWWLLVAKTVAPVRGMEKGKFLLLHLRERELLFRAHFAHLSKVVVLVAKTVAPVRGMEQDKIQSLSSQHFFLCK